MDDFNTLFEKAETYFKTFMGKPGHNPFFALQKMIELRKAHEKGDKTAIDKLKAIKLEPPVTTQKPLETIHKTDPVPATPPSPVEKALEEQKKPGVDIQTPKPVEAPQKSMSNKK